MSEALLDALEARHGIVCAVGAGGKKTTLYALARAHPGRVGLTSTVFMTTFSRRLGARRLITAAADWPATVAAAAPGTRILAWAPPSEKSGRVGGIPPVVVADCHAAGGFDVTYVKADGARMRAIKAPRADEPVVPTTAGTVLWLVSAAAFGQLLTDRIAHRPDEIAAVTGLSAGDAITPESVARLMTSPRGMLRNLPAGARVIPVINAVDDGEREALAREAAAAALATPARFDRVVLTSHRDGPAVVAVVEA